jgi:inhibitor of KinA
MRLYPLGDCALTVELSTTLSRETNDIVHLLAHLVDEVYRQGHLKGFVECVPAFTTLTILYNPLEISLQSLSQTVEYCVAEAKEIVLHHSKYDTSRRASSRLVQVPVCFAEQFAADAGELAYRCGLTVEGMIALLTSREYSVAMVGFTPGFPYLLGLDEQLHTPRKAIPRNRVPAGSVAIGGGQLGMYPLETPGGWHIIGRTPLRLFYPLTEAEHSCLLRAGDTVRLEVISEKEFAEYIVHPSDYPSAHQHTQ